MSVATSVVFAPDAVAVVAEDRGADRAGGEADRVGGERRQCAGVRARAGEEQLREDECGCRPVQEEVGPLDRRPDGPRDHGAANLLAPLVRGGTGRALPPS
jgi:hypothetical protein